MKNVLLFVLIGPIGLGLMVQKTTEAAALPQKIYTCGLNQTEGEPERLQYDLRLETYNGRVQIVEKGAREAFKAISGHPDFMFLNALITPAPEQGSGTRFPYQARVAGEYVSNSWIATTSIQVQYFQVQLGSHTAAVKISGSSHPSSGGAGYSTIHAAKPGNPESYNFRVLIRVFPGLFNTRSYWIASEERWAFTAEEAVADVVIRSLRRFEQYLEEQLGRSGDLLASIETIGGVNVSQGTITKRWNSWSIDRRQVSVTGLLSQFGFSFSSGSKP